MHAASNKKLAGVLLHISSLPKGNIGVDAYRFIDFLASTGANVWQTLPINMPADNSPYQCISTHAGNPAFIDYEQLIDHGLLNTDEINLDSRQRLGIAYQNFIDSHSTVAFTIFCEFNQFWLQDFAIYLLLRKLYNFSCWNTWPNEYKHRDQASLNLLKTEHAQALEVIKFTQYLFFMQWDKLKSYAEENQIKLFGDIPIFVAYDSADVGAEPHLFKLDENKEMTVVAGVPPDYFSETGQRWGNPHYDWPAMEKDQFSWWLTRIETQTRLFHMLRIDHFRGLEAAWEIPAEEPNAIKGKWVNAPGDALLASIQTRFPDIELIAEDLGEITEEVNALRLKYALPGMKILHFAFGGDNDNPYLPHNIEENSVTYTGTHDNDTTLGWYQSLDTEQQQNFETYLKQTGIEKLVAMPFTLIEMAFNTTSNLVIIPMQDILELDTEHRMNVPGTIEGNWQWRFDWSQLNSKQIHQFSEAIYTADRK